MVECVDKLFCRYPFLLPPLLPWVPRIFYASVQYVKILVLTQFFTKKTSESVEKACCSWTENSPQADMIIVYDFEWIQAYVLIYCQNARSNCNGFSLIRLSQSIVFSPIYILHFWKLCNYMCSVQFLALLLWKNFRCFILCKPKICCSCLGI